MCKETLHYIKSMKCSTCAQVYIIIYIHIHIYTIYYSVNGTIIHMQQWLRSYTLYIHTTYTYILHTIHLVLVTFTIAMSGFGLFIKSLSNDL